MISSALPLKVGVDFDLVRGSWNHGRFISMKFGHLYLCLKMVGCVDKRPYNIQF